MRFLNVFVVLILTTAGFTCSARSAKEAGVFTESKGDTADAICISGAPDDVKEDRSTSTSETMKEATKNAIKNIKNVLRFLLSIYPPVLIKCAAELQFFFFNFFEYNHRGTFVNYYIIKLALGSLKYYCCCAKIEHLILEIGFMSILGKIGHFQTNLLKSLTDIFFFSGKVLIRIFQLKTYNSATRSVLVNQIYFTSVQILPVFISVSILFGSLLIGIVFQALKGLGMTDLFGNILMGLIVTELSPFFTVLLLTLRSGSAINTEIAVMKVNREIKTLEIFHIDVVDYLIVPRVINGVVSLVLLSSLFSIVLMFSGILFSKIIFGMSIDAYSNILLNSANFSDIVIALVKCAIFGFFVTLIPIRSGLRASDELTSIPIVVSAGMVNVFTAIMIIEVLSLITKLF